jgi:hypothetical protein
VSLVAFGAVTEAVIQGSYGSEGDGSKRRWQEGGNTVRSPRGNPEKLNSQRTWIAEKVTNLERGGLTRESRAELFAGQTLKGHYRMRKR